MLLPLTSVSFVNLLRADAIKIRPRTFLAIFVLSAERDWNLQLGQKNINFAGVKEGVPGGIFSPKFQGILVTPICDDLAIQK